MSFGIGEILGVIGVAGVPLTLALTMPATTTGEFRFLKVCLILSGAFIIASLFVIQWTENSGSIHMRALLNAVIAAIVVGGVSYGLNWIQKKQNSTFETISQPEIREGIGGKGGGAKVGGSGIAIGAPGGLGGRYGLGGNGGTAEVGGEGFAAGGAGGAAGDDGVWRAPAKSGYEIFQRQMGLPVDPFMRQFGRGGAGAGYAPKLEVVEQLRAAYFSKHSKNTESIFENINAVPLDYLNKALAEKKEIWRVRIVDDEYEFFIPKD